MIIYELKVPEPLKAAHFIYKQFLLLQERNKVVNSKYHLIVLTNLKSQADQVSAKVAQYWAWLGSTVLALHPKYEIG